MNEIKIRLHKFLDRTIFFMLASLFLLLAPSFFFSGAVIFPIRSVQITFFNIIFLGIFVPHCVSAIVFYSGVPKNKWWEGKKVGRAESWDNWVLADETSCREVGFPTARWEDIASPEFWTTKLWLSAIGSNFNRNRYWSKFQSYAELPALNETL